MKGRILREAYDDLDRALFIAGCWEHEDNLTVPVACNLTELIEIHNIDQA